MPLPQTVVEQLSREPKTTPGWAGRLFLFSGTLLFLSVVIYVGLAFGYTAYLTSNFQKMQDQVHTFSEQVPAVDQARLINFYSQISNLKTILAAHIFTTPFFAWLEKNTEINVSFIRLDLNVQNGQANFSGTAKSMADLQEQLILFREQPHVNRVIVNSINFADGVWRFDIVLSFAPGYFASPPLSPAPGLTPVSSTTTP